MSLSTSNIFAALDTKKKKKNSKVKDVADKKKKAAVKPDRSLEFQQHLFSGQSKPAVSNWADTDEEDEFEDDIGPLPQSWLPSGPSNGSVDHKNEDATDSDEDAHEALEEELGMEISKDEEEEEDEQAADEEMQGEEAASASGTQPAVLAPAPVQERQLSKKEQKKRELEEMNRVLAELGIETATPAATSDQKAEHEGVREKATVDENANSSEAATAAAAAAKKKKKKDKEKKLVGTDGEASAQTDDVADLESEQPTIIDPAEARKLLAKKKAAATAKKSSASAAATLAAREAKERAAKKAKVKDKKNYNQAPTR